jgi:hypothetical protein
MAGRLIVLGLAAAAGLAYVAGRRRRLASEAAQNGGSQARVARLRREIEQARERLREDIARAREQS